jgi:Clp amino terminal domain, pathogenicity island component
MFERYTEKARRTIFFARYEASQFGSPYIESEHLLLGLLREDKALTHRFLCSHASVESIRKQIEGHTMFREKVSTSVDLPLSNECKRVLAYAAEEAERLSHKHIGTEHLWLGLLREEKCFAAAILRERGLTLAQLRDEFAEVSPDDSALGRIPRVRQIPLEIHGFAMDADYIRERVRACRKFKWHWHKSTWKARDLAVRKDGQMSFDVSLVADTKNFDLKQGGWKKDYCAICRWELFESEDQPEHGTGYTNGRDWVCTECYEKFLKGPDYFSTAHPEIT